MVAMTDECSGLLGHNRYQLFNFLTTCHTRHTCNCRLIVLIVFMYL